jgi:hypothetical protein
MNEPTAGTVLQRLNRLEHQVRWWKGLELLWVCNLKQESGCDAAPERGRRRKLLGARPTSGTFLPYHAANPHLSAFGIVPIWHLRAPRSSREEPN